jgi:ribosomal protein L37AE/L43A
MTTTTKKQQTQRHAEGCPACSHKLVRAVEGATQLYRCAKCEAIFGNCYLGDSYTHVLPFMVAAEPPADQIRYFDFTCLGSAGITRRHGWYDTASKRIVQVG